MSNKNPKRDPDSRGSCSCGWKGPWRTSISDSRNDMRRHCRDNGHYEDVAYLDYDDLMPHERRKLEREGAQ